MFFKVAKVFLITAISFGLSACEQKTEPETFAKPVIRIGVSLPLSGNLAVYGNTLQKALLLALADVQKDNLKFSYELIFADDSYDLKKTLLNLNRFKAVNNVNAVMSFWGNAGILTSNWAQKNKIIHLGCASSDKVGQGFYNFNHCTQPQTYINRMMKYFHDNNYKKIGFAYLQALEIQEFIDNWLPVLKQHGFEIVFSTPFSPQQRDMKMEILKMKESSPDVVEVLMNSPSVNIFGKTAREMGFNVPMSSINNLTDAIEEYEGQTFLTEDSGNPKFTQYFEKSSGLQQLPCVVNFYDGLRMLVHAYETLQKDGLIPENEKVVEFLLSDTSYNSVLNSIKIDKEGNIDSPAVLKRIVNGIPITVDK